VVCTLVITVNFRQRNFQ